MEHHPSQLPRAILANDPAVLGLQPFPNRQEWELPEKQREVDLAFLQRLSYLHGTLEMLILRVLDEGSENGFAIAKRIAEMSTDTLLIEEGSLYPALYRMERRGWILPRWGRSANNRRAKFYRLTAAGRMGRSDGDDAPVDEQGALV